MGASGSPLTPHLPGNWDAGSGTCPGPGQLQEERGCRRKSAAPIRPFLGSGRGAGRNQPARSLPANKSSVFGEATLAPSQRGLSPRDTAHWNEVAARLGWHGAVAWQGGHPVPPLVSLTCPC